MKEQCLSLSSHGGYARKVAILVSSAGYRQNYLKKLCRHSLNYSVLQEMRILPEHSDLVKNSFLTCAVRCEKIVYKDYVPCNKGKPV